MCMTTYGNDSIRKKSDWEAVRTRVYNYAGGSDKRGAFHTVHEILSNSIDEFKAKHGTQINVSYSDRKITVEDFGRGVPMDFNEVENEYNYDLIFMQLNAGGKGSGSEKEDLGYNDAIGLNGIGAGLSILSSSYAKVESIRDGYKYTMEWENGKPIYELKKEKSNAEYTGTKVEWIPDLTVFDENDFPKDWFTSYLDEQAIVNAGLRLVLQYENDEVEEFYYENGILDYINKININGISEPIFYETDYILGRDVDTKPEYRSRYQFAFAFNNHNYKIESFHNSSFLKHGGAPHDAVKLAFTYMINKQINDFGLYNKKESKISFDDIQESLIVITNTYSTETSYQNQTKFAITNKFIKSKLNELLREQIQVFFIENQKVANNICKQVLANKRAREKAEKTRIDIREKLSSNITSMKINERVEGLINCSDKLEPEKHILAICEGKSALSSIKEGRTKYHAIMPIRGKILNCFKSNVDTILKNEVITSIYKALGCGMEIGKVGSSTHTFDINKLKFQSVEIYVDADEDGMGSIFPLLLSMFWVCSPTLIREHRIKLGVTPKYLIRTSDETLYAMTDSDLEDIKKTLKGSYEIGYVKGLAELNSEGMAMSMDINNNKNIVVELNNEKESIDILELFMSDGIERRQEYILQSFTKENISEIDEIEGID